MPSSNKTDEVRPEGGWSSSELTSRARSIPSLDGLRALAIALVLLAHLGEDRVTNARLSAYLFELGQVGVSLFFVISGFLITFLLEKEKTLTKSIDLKVFYIRRTFRIFPPFYVYLAIVLILWAFGFQENWPSIIASATYTWNYYLKSHGALLSSTSSLSLEEQFYLLWPFCMKAMRLRDARRLAVLLILLMPFSRALTGYFFPAVHASGKVSIMLHSRLDTLMFGCLLALLWRSERFSHFTKHALRPWSLQASWIAALIVLPLGTLFLGIAYRLVYLSLLGVALTWMLIYVVRRPTTLAGRFLNWAPIKYVGVLSYSLYLYQQMFTGFFFRNVPLNLVCAFGAAICSYYCVEKPSLGLRDRILHQRRVESRA